MTDTNKQVISFDIRGIKCDNPHCGWSDMRAQFIPEKYLNAPCPECGDNLFTQSDYETMLRMFAAARFINTLCRPFMPILRRCKTKKATVEMNGTGKVKIREEA